MYEIDVLLTPDEGVKGNVGFKELRLTGKIPFPAWEGLSICAEDGGLHGMITITHLICWKMLADNCFFECEGDVISDSPYEEFRDAFVARGWKVEKIE